MCGVILWSLLFAHCCLPFNVIVGCRCWSFGIGCCFAFGLPVVGCWLLIVDCWLVFVRCWLLFVVVCVVVGCWLIVGCSVCGVCCLLCVEGFWVFWCLGIVCLFVFVL